MSFDARRRNYVNEKIKKYRLAGKWIFAMAIILVVVLLFLFVGLPHKPYIK